MGLQGIRRPACRGGLDTCGTMPAAIVARCRAGSSREHRASDAARDVARGGRRGSRGSQRDDGRSRASLDPVRALGWGSTGPLQGVRGDPGVPRKPVEPLPARTGQEAPHAARELAGPHPHGCGAPLLPGIPRPHGRQTVWRASTSTLLVDEQRPRPTFESGAQMNQAPRAWLASDWIVARRMTLPGAPGPLRATATGTAVAGVASARPSSRAGLAWPCPPRRSGPWFPLPWLLPKAAA